MKYSHARRRMSVLRAASIAFAALAVLAGPQTIAAPASSAGASSANPNVLFIAIDDLRDWVGFSDRKTSQARTPNLDRLAKMGVAFTRNYCSSPLCNPSRAALMSGMRASTTGIYTNNHDWRPVISSEQTLNGVFRRAGYRVTAAGKIYHGSFSRPEDCDHYQKTPPSRDDPPPGAKPGVGGIRFAAIDAEDSDLDDYAIADYGIAELQKKQDKPFFLAVGFHKPHMPWNVPRKYFDLFPLEKIQLPPYREDDLADIPPAGLRTAHPETDHQPMQKSGRWKEAIQAYLATIAYLDMNIGWLLDAFEKSSHRDNTIVVLWSDHGWHLGEKHHWRKFALWEEATRSPLLWIVPGVTKPGSVCARPVDMMHIFPTLMDLCGLPKPSHVESASIRPLLANPAAAWERPAVTTHHFKDHTVRTDEWRYIRYENGDEELYNEKSDPNEWTNLAARPEHAALKTRLAAHLPQKNTPARKDSGPDGGKKKKVRK